MSNLEFRRIVLVMLVLMFVGVTFAHAQSADVFFGVGTATDSSTGQQINTFGNGVLYPTPKMTGAFGTFGADFMFKPQLGFGGEDSFRFAQGSYAGLNYRPSFYDFNVIWKPIPSSKFVVPVLQAGLGGAKLSYYYSQAFCDAFAGCSSSNQYLESSNHFQLHLAAGAQIYVKGGMFIRPQVDVHWVHNLFQFGSDWVPQYSMAIGYTFGR